MFRQGPAGLFAAVLLLIIVNLVLLGNLGAIIQDLGWAVVLTVAIFGWPLMRLYLRIRYRDRND